MSLDQGEHETRREGSGISTTRRRIPWRLGPPAFVAADADNPTDLTLHSLRNRRVFIVGKPQTGGAVAIGSVGAVKCYTDGHFPLVVCSNRAQVTYAAAWFGEGGYSPELAEQVWHWLESAIVREFRDDGARLLLTPATTGRDLLARSIPAGDGWPVMSADVQDVVRHTAGQGRMEVMPNPHEGTFPGRLTVLHEYDARMAYVSLMRELPIGDPEHLTNTAHAWAEQHPYNEGRYRVTWKAPAGWRHPGILPAHGDMSDGPDWVWPLAGEGWCGGAELFTAWGAGWDVDVAEGYVWARRGDPFRAWRDRLLRILAASDELPGQEPRMVRNAVRAIILHTIGAIHGAPHKTSEYGDSPPDNARHVRLLRDGRFAWETLSRPAWPEMVHPEWSATIWGRARARLLRSHNGRAGALTVKPAELVAFRTDAVYTTRPTGWEDHDNGQPGRYRHARYTFTSAQPWPRNGLDVLRMKGGADVD